MAEPGPDLLEQAADWALILRHDSPDARQLAEFRRWLAQGPDHAAAWARAQAVLGLFQGLPPAVARPVLAEAAAHPDRRRMLLALAGFGMAAGGLAWRQPWRAWQADLTTAVGQRRSWTLPDRSLVVLNTASAANLAFTPAERRIRLLDGEILVTSGLDPAPAERPLLVETGLGEVRALGTRFSVRQLDDRIRVAVFRHAVEIRPRNAPPRRLAAGGQVDFAADGLRGRAAVIDDSAAVWEQGMLLAQDMALGQVVAEMARYRHGILHCDPQVAAIRVSGAISLADTDSGLDLLARTLPVRVLRRSPWWVVVAARG